MRMLLDHPLLLFLVSFAFLWAATRVGARLQRRRYPLDDTARADFDIVLGASLTLLSLLVGFSFSMASSRYDQRKIFEENEANAIGTAYSRAGLLSSADTLKVRLLLRDYLNLRIKFYTTVGLYTVVDDVNVRDLHDATSHLQEQLWEAVATAAKAAPSATTALAAASMNDAINSQGYAQAAAWNRIPLGAWVLQFVLGAVATAMIGYRFRIGARHALLTLILPGIVATAFFLIADIDCPRGGVIRITPQNLLALAPSLN